MAVELLKEYLDVNTATRKESIQVVKERDIIVPDGKPDMQRVLLLEGDLDMHQIDVQEDRILYKGEMNTTITYVSEENESRVYTMKGKIPIEDFVIVEGIDKDQKVAFDYRVEHLHWNILNERKINVKGIIEVNVVADKIQEVQMLTDISTDEAIESKRKKIEIIKASPMRSEKTIIQDGLTIVQDKGSVGEILSMYAVVKEEQVRRTEDEILFNGVVEITTMYKAMEEANTLEVISHRIPFAGESSLVRSEREVYWDYEIGVQITNAQVSPDYDGEDRVIDVEGSVKLDYMTYDRIEQDVIDDLYCPGKNLNCIESSQQYVTLKNRMDMSIPAKEMLPIEGISPENNEIFAVKVKATVDEKMIEGNKLVISGMLDFAVIYTEKEGMNPVVVYTTMIPFEQEFTVLEDMINGEFDVKVVPKDIQVINQSNGEISIEYVLKYLINGYDEQEMVIIEDIEFVEMERDELDAYPSIVVYITKKGDDLWEMAKRFNTTVKDIVEINGLDEKSTIYPGQKIMILKKVVKN